MEVAGDPIPVRQHREILTVLPGLCPLERQRSLVGESAHGVDVLVGRPDHAAGVSDRDHKRTGSPCGSGKGHEQRRAHAGGALDLQTLGESHRRTVRDHVDSCPRCASLTARLQQAFDGTPDGGRGGLAGARCSDEEGLILYLMRGLSAQDRAAIESHLSHCDSCVYGISLLRKRLRIDDCVDRAVPSALREKVREVIEATKVADICARADVAHQTFFNHFPTKQDLVREIARTGHDFFVAAIETAITEGRSTGERLARLFAAIPEAAATAGPMQSPVTMLKIALSGDSTRKSTTSCVKRASATKTNIAAR